MSVAEKLEARGREAGREKGREEGREEGARIGAIRMLEEFLGLPVSSTDSLDELAIEELDTRQRELRREYDARVKRC